MAKTAVVNKRRRRRRNPTASTTNRKRKRRRNYSAASAVNPRRRRRRSSRRAAPRSRRRRNPISPYSSTSYYRRPNPMSFDVMHDFTEVMPAATAGIWASRYALRQAGAFEADSKTGVLEPGIKHAIAIYLAATMGSQLIGSVLGSDKQAIAKIAALGFGGDLFLRTRFMKDSEFVKNQLSLQGLGYDDDEPDAGGYYVPDGMSGFQEQSALGAAMTDAFGNTYVSTSQGWQLAGGELVQDGDGNVWELGQAAGGARLAGFAQQSPLGNAQASSTNSFGYSR